MPAVSPHRLRLALLPVAFLLLSALPGLGAAPTLKNRSFDQGLEGWHRLPDTAGVTIAPDRSVVHTGAASMRLWAEGAQNPWLAQGLAQIRPGAVYALSAWARRSEGPGRAALKLEFYTWDNEYLRGYYGVLPEDAPADWQQLRVQGEAPEGAAKAALILRLLGPGTVHFDEVEFSLVLPPAPFTLSPSRLVAEAATQTALDLGVRVREGRRPAETPRAVLHGAGLDGPRPLEVSEQPGVEGQDFALRVNLPPTPPGVYDLRLSWPELDTLAVQVLLLPPRPAATAPRLGQALERGGRPFFPLGLYRVPPGDFPAVAAGGLNLAQIPPPEDAASLLAALDQAQRHNLALLVPLYPALDGPEALAQALELVEAAREHPALFGWLLADEPELRPEATRALPELYLRVHEADPAHPALIACGPNADLASWAPLCDLLLVQFFPRPDELPGAAARRLGETAAALGGQAWLATLPAGWPGYAGPSPEEARALLYHALGAGASGVMWFTLREGDFRLTATPLWNAFPAVHREARELVEALQQGERWEEVRVGVEQVRAVAVRVPEAAYVLLLNDSPHPLQGGVSLPAGVAEAHYLDTGEAVSVRDNAFRFSLPPGGARALRVRLTPD